MKKNSATAVFLSILLVTPSFAASYNLTAPEKKTATIDDESYSFELSKYEPPYAHIEPYLSPEVADLSSPEGVDRAAESSIGRDPDWYLSLHDDKLKKQYQSELDTDQFFKDWNKSSSPPKDLRNRISFYDEFLYKVEFDFEGRRYAVIAAKAIENGKKFDNIIVKSFVKKGDKWFFTDDVRHHPLADLVGFYDYDGFTKMLGGIQPEEDRGPIKVVLIPQKKEYHFGEALEFDMTLQNTSDKPISIYAGLQPLGRSSSITFKHDKSIAYIGFGAKKELLRAEDLKILEPQQTMTAHYSISDYGQSETGDISQIPKEGGEDGDILFLLPQGPLEATATYYFPPQQGEIPSFPGFPNLQTSFWNSKPITIELLAKEPLAVEKTEEVSPLQGK